MDQILHLKQLIAKDEIYVTAKTLKMKLIGIGIFLE